MLVQTTYSVNASQQIDIVHRRKDVTDFRSTILVSGTMGGGTLAFYLSIDGGTTKVPLKDLTGIAMTSTGDTGDNFDVNLGNTNTNSTNLSIWATLTGSTSPNLLVSSINNR